MNVYDSQRMADVAGHEGYSETAAIEDAELVVLNTCHIRERASEKIYSELGKIRELKQARAASGRKTTLVVAGCVAQAEGREILRRQPAVDLVVGPQNYHRLPELLAARAGRRRCRHRISRSKTSSITCPPPPGSDTRARRHAPMSPCRKAATNSARFAWCPIRAAPKARARPPRCSPRSSDSRGGRARIHAARPERQRLSRAGRARRRRRSSRSYRAGGAHSRRLAAALCDLASATTCTRT